FNLSASGIDTGGFNVCRYNQTPFADCNTMESDDDGYRELSGSLRAGYRFDNNLEVDLHLLHADGDTEFDGSFQNETKSIQQVVGGTLRYAPIDNWQLTLAAGRSQDKSNNFKDGVFSTRFDTKRDALSLQNDFSIGDAHVFTLGVDYQDDKVDSTTDYTVTSRDNKGLFTQYQGMFSEHDLQLSLRQDDNEQFGEHATGSAAWGYAFSEALWLSASYGTAFKAPTFNELYWPDGYGNPDLGPEESKSFELGLGGQADWGNWSLNAYETRIDDLIAYDASTSAIANVNKARIRGLEGVLTTRVRGWNLDANVTLLDPKNRSSGDESGNVLPRRAEQSLRVDADRQFGQYAIGATLFTEGRRYDDLKNSDRLGGYAILDLRAEYEFARDWRVQARIENLLDKEYETAAFYNQPGRGVFVGVRYQP
ncbi:MAG: TonB-dependent receptor, partial [Gammaproteobacteria bacterium]|nr:TonB-dependent receptor [Gammaproteobacteria bacterium]NNJ84817.1 TonB-dependent receptor [Gammaproteobacteria bacterium]